MACNANRKGKVFELFVSHWLKSIGIPARRGKQYCGDSSAPDVIGPEGLHIEAKAVQSLNLTNAMEQAVKDCGPNIPSVWHKKNRGEMMITIRAKDLLAFCKIFNDKEL